MVWLLRTCLWFQAFMNASNTHLRQTQLLQDLSLGHSEGRDKEALSKAASFLGYRWYLPDCQGSYQKCIALLLNKTSRVNAESSAQHTVGVQLILTLVIICHNNPLSQL